VGTNVAETKQSASGAKAKPERLVSLDVFRGVTIAGMILVNDPGSWSYVYGPLRHAEWHGWTPTDLVFPFFLFIVGVAITLALEGRIARGESHGGIFKQILRRTLILFGLGLLLNALGDFDWSTLRIPGVLQRIALCYFFTSLIFIKTGKRGQIIIAVALLIVYWLLLTLVPVPGYGAGVLTPEGNLAAYVDNRLMRGHLWKPTWDPEGLLSTIPAVATTILGVLTGYWLKSSRSGGRKTVGLLIAGVIGVLIGEIMNIWFPINKNLWTSSFVVFTAGMACLFLAACYWLVDVKGYRKLVTPFVMFGVNPIVVYVLSSIGAGLLDFLQVTAPGGQSVALKDYIYEYLLASWAGPMNGSLFFALGYVLFWLGPMAVLYRKRIFIKV
jgi:predicted acyltransferase